MVLSGGVRTIPPPPDKNCEVLAIFIVLEQNDITSAREAFDAFLERYPYCYGYWKKYTDLEKKNNNTEEAEKVCNLMQSYKASMIYGLVIFDPLKCLSHLKNIFFYFNPFLSHFNFHLLEVVLLPRPSTSSW